jgi:hypothetical protein
VSGTNLLVFLFSGGGRGGVFIFFLSDMARGEVKSEKGTGLGGLRAVD